MTQANSRPRPAPGLELLAIVLWALIITRPYLTLDPTLIPNADSGTSEYLTIIQYHDFWRQVQTCGGCALWNGTMGGGNPALADPYPGLLHPLVAIPTLLFGVFNGAKVMVIGAFVMAGWAQWWLAWELGLGRVARLWSAFLAVAAGHLSGRMEPGFVGIVLSTAACTLALPPLLALAREVTVRRVIVLALILAAAIVSGQSYMQVALLLTLPALLVFLPGKPQAAARFVLSYLAAGLLALLVAAPFLVPFFHFLPQVQKLSDPRLDWGQPLVFSVLNLVIDDPRFYYSDDLQRMAVPGLYTLYIGWIPLTLALMGLRSARTQAELRCVGFLALCAAIPLLIASREPINLLASGLPVRLAEAIFSVRSYPLFAGLAVAPILALAAWQLERWLSMSSLRCWRLGLGRRGHIAVNPGWLLAVPLLFALSSVWSFSSHWIKVKPIPPQVYTVLEAVPREELAWVQVPPIADTYLSIFLAPAVEQGLKVSNGYRSWHWKGRPAPAPGYALVYPTNDPPARMQQLGVVEGLGLFRASSGNPYAQVLHTGGRVTPCAATGLGGMIDVRCLTQTAGVLVVQENRFAGWQVFLGEQSLELVTLNGTGDANRWLSVYLPPGEHVLQLRYRPWDVVLGLTLGALGLTAALVGWCWSWRLWR